MPLWVASATKRRLTRCRSRPNGSLANDVPYASRHTHQQSRVSCLRIGSTQQRGTGSSHHPAPLLPLGRRCFRRSELSLVSTRTVKGTTRAASREVDRHFWDDP